MAKYQRYEEYKEAGVEWLDKVPNHWIETSLKYHLKSIVAGGTPESSNDSYWALSGEGIPWVSIADMSRSFEVHKTNKDVTVKGKVIKNLKIVPKDTILYSIFASLGKVAIAKVPLVTNQAILGLEPSSSLYSGYLVYWLKYLEPYLSLYSTSNTQDNLNAEKVGNLPLLMTDLYEQTQIANFLDHETAQIDTLIENQQTLIQLLKEKRQAVISHAVTKGLNPDAPMKDSGVEWLGEVPEHWVSIQLGRVCRQVSDGPHFSPTYVDEGVMFLSARNIGVDAWYLDDAKFISEKDYKDFCRRVVPEKGDVLYTKGGTTGVARVVDLDQPFQVWVHVAVLKLKFNLINPNYAAFVLNSIGCYEQSQLYTRGATNQDLGLTRMIKIWFALPPIEEQNAIIDFLDQKVIKIDALINNAYKGINLLRERRTALISAAVTGKIDVRGWRAVGVEA